MPTKPLLAAPFASSGDKNTIPAASQAGGVASLADGFPAITEQPIAAGGLPPQRKDFNGILHLLSQFAFYQQSGGLFEWADTLDYTTPAMVVGSDGRIYLALQDSGPGHSGEQDPLTSPEYWIDILAMDGFTLETSDDSDKLATTAFVHSLLGGSGAGFGSRQIFSSAGSASFTVPAGVTRIFAQVWGGGGGGGSCVTNGAGGGGGGGGYSEKIITGLTPGATIAVTVGAGGAGGVANGSAGSSGSASSLGAHCSATGGGGGAASTGPTFIAGGSGGAGSGGDKNVDGGNGLPSIDQSSFDIIGGGGDSFMHPGTAQRASNGYSSSPYAGINATNPGTGGSGSGSTSHPGGNGAPGQVIIWY